MRSSSFFLKLFIFSVFAPALAFAAPKCINDASPKNTKLLDSFNANNDTLKALYASEKKQYDKSVKPVGLCSEVNLDTNKFHLAQQIEEVAKAQAPKSETYDQFAVSELSDANTPKNHLPALIKRECIAASLQRKPGQNGYACVADKKTGEQSVERNYGNVGGKTVPCITDEMVDYVQFAVNRAIKCLSPEANPVDSRVIYQKFNNETGFNYSIAWDGGAGVGQLTTPAVKEQTIGNGKYVLESVANSTKKSCQGFSEIAKDDLKSRPRISGNYCAFVSAGDGLTRNLLHAVGYYLTLRDQYVLPSLMKESMAFSKNKEIVSALVAIGYSADTMKKAWALIDKAAQYKNPTPDCKKRKLNAAQCYLEMIQKNSPYLAAIKDKMGEVYCIKDGLSGDACEAKKKSLSKSQIGANECVKQP